MGGVFKSPLAVLRSFFVYRFLLGLGEAPSWPAATKAVSESFPKEERGWAVALIASGSSIGGAIGPVLVVGSIWDWAAVGGRLLLSWARWGSFG
jgi:MFS family permease